MAVFRSVYRGRSNDPGVCDADRIQIRSGIFAVQGSAEICADARARGRRGGDQDGVHICGKQFYVLVVLF